MLRFFVSHPAPSIALCTVYQSQRFIQEIPIGPLWFLVKEPLLEGGFSRQGRVDQFPNEAAAADLAGQHQLAAIRLASTWLVANRNEWTPIKKDDLSWNSAICKQLQRSWDPRHPPTPLRASSFAWLCCWTRVKLVNVNKQEIELVFVVSLMKPLWVLRISPFDFPLFAFFCFSWFNVLLGSGSFTFYFQTREGRWRR